MSQFIEMFKGDNQVPLGDICNIEKGATITRNDVLPGEVPVVAGGQEPSCYHNVANREAGAITVSASGAYAGYINFWNCPIFASDCNTIISKDDEKTDQTFVYFGLRAMQKQIYGLQKGGAQPHVYGKDLQKFMFPCPSYAKQIEFSKMAKQADKSKFGDFKSQFIEMFGGLCQDTPWSDVVTITNGKAYPEEYQEEGAYPICGSGGIMCYGEKKLCNGNTTILGRKGNINNPIFMESGYWIVDTAFSIDVDKAKLHPKFFYYWCCQYDFTKLNKQGVLPSLTRKDLEKVKMAIPQMRDQLKFVSIAEQADKSKSVIQKALVYLNDIQSDELGKIA